MQREHRGPRRRGKRWCFTINNWTDADEQRLRGLEDDCEYLVCGREKGSGRGTAHLQGYVNFKRRCEFATGEYSLLNLTIAPDNVYFLTFS